MAENEAENLIVKRHYPELDGLRGIAILLVLWWHSSEIALSVFVPSDSLSISYYYYSIIGATGVSLFFVLSGFLITGLLMDSAGDKNGLKYFYIRRFFRIFPLYYASLILFSVVSFICISEFNFQERILYYILYIQNFGFVFSNDLPFINENWRFFDHFWSLAVEEQFYLVWPVFFLWVYRNINFSETIMIFIGLIVISVVTRYYMTLNGIWQYAHISTISRVDALIMGAMVAYIMKLKPAIFIDMQKFVRLYFPAITIILLVMLHYLFLDGYLYLIYARYIILIADIYFVLLLVSVMGRHASDGAFQSFLCSGILRLIAKVSYGIYVFHILVYEILKYYLLQYPSIGYWGFHLMLLFGGGGITFVISWLSYKYFEKPILLLKDKYAPLR